MEKINAKLTMYDDGLSADLLVATPFQIDNAEDFLGVFQTLNVRFRVLSLVRGASRWLLHLRVSESDASRLDANRASEILRGVNLVLTSEASAGLASRAA
jgi:hypothetical protein